MKLMESPRANPLSFRHRFGSRYAPFIERGFFLGHDPFEDYPVKKPKVNIRQEGSYYEMQIALPGYKKEELEIEVKGDVLTISGCKKEEEKEATDYVLKEYGTTHFKRSLQLSPLTDRENITASFKNGVLHLTLHHRKARQGNTKASIVKVR